MFEFEQILAANSNNQFDYIDYFNHPIDLTFVHEQYSTQQENIRQEFTIGKLDLFDDPNYKNAQQHCRNSAFKKKVEALSIEYVKEKIIQQSHDTIRPAQDLVQLSSYSIEQRQFGSYSKKIQPIRQKKSQNFFKKHQSNKDPYPTKNILPCFRSYFLNYILQKSPQSKNLEIIRRILGKHCINLQDYQDLFIQPILRPILAEYFKKNQLYRDLIQSRVQHKLKVIYLSKIPVFQEAFRLGVFQGIN